MLKTRSPLAISVYHRLFHIRKRMFGCVRQKEGKRQKAKGLEPKGGAKSLSIAPMLSFFFEILVAGIAIGFSACEKNVGMCEAKRRKTNKGKGALNQKAVQISHPPYAARVLSSFLSHRSLFSSIFWLLDTSSFPTYEKECWMCEAKRRKTNKGKEVINQKPAQIFLLPYAARVLSSFLNHRSLFSSRSLSILPSIHFDIRSFLISTCSLLIVHHIHSVRNRLRLRATNRARVKAYVGACRKGAPAKEQQQVSGNRLWPSSSTNSLFLFLLVFSTTSLPTDSLLTYFLSIDPLHSQPSGQQNTLYTLYTLYTPITTTSIRPTKEAHTKVPV